MLQNVDYCPVLHTRVAEIKALANLGAATKDRIFPLLVARPWPNAKALSRTWEKITDAVGERRFAIDLDRTREASTASTAAALDFSNLFLPNNGFENYYSEVSDIPFAVPVFRLAGDAATEFAEQVAHIEAIDRGVVLRLEYGRVSDPVSLVQNVKSEIEDVAIFVDMGWSKDLLSRQAWASSIIAGIANLEPEAEMVLTGSSFPDSFTGIGARGTVPILERELHARLVREHNAANIVYGDWGSTRPPSVESGPMRNTPRIDLPGVTQCLCFRKDGSEGYQEIARRMMSDNAWPVGLQIWGTYTVECTAQGIPGAIRSAGTAAAARVNIHMHHQVHTTSPDLASDADEPFVD